MKLYFPPTFLALLLLWVSITSIEALSIQYEKRIGKNYFGKGRVVQLSLSSADMSLFAPVRPKFS
ncbi:MAG: hypothetical protein J7K38_05175, partial [Thermoplasmata archaeon]|nr:hypothetical protein [Thermoplasmata archaeon]